MHLPGLAATHCTSFWCVSGLCNLRLQSPLTHQKILASREAVRIQQTRQGVPCFQAREELAQIYIAFILDISCELEYMCSMNQVVTAKLKLHTTPEQFHALRQTQLAYRNALNAVSRYAFEHGKMSNQQALQRGMYGEIRATYNLPAQMACNVPRQVGATYKTLWTKVKQNAAQRKAGKTKKRYKGLDKAPTYVSPTLTYNYRRDYSLKQAQQVSILTLQGRMIVPYTGYSKHVAWLQQDAHLGAAKLWYDKPHKQFYLLISLQVEGADPTPHTQISVAGVDVGVRYLAVTSTTRGECSFHPGKGMVAKANHYARLRKRLQQKGTRSATRRLIALSGRERRLKQDANHVVSQRIVTQYPQPHRIGEPDRYQRSNPWQAWQESDEEATACQCRLLQVVVC